jgi:hypothetical protein
MPETPDQRQFREDARVLGHIGWRLVHSDMPDVEVRLPRALAESAVAAWERDHEGPADPESHEQRAQRHHAGTLGLIGLSIENGGRWEADEVVVGLSPNPIGNAVNAADDLPSEELPWPPVDRSE